MEKKLAILWIICLMFQTKAATKITNSPTMHRFSIHQKNLNYFHQKALDDMKFHIKKVLNLHNFQNSTLDKFISSMFNINNENPTYVFELPGKATQRVVLRRSDFSKAIYPNVTNVNKFPKNSQGRKLQASSSNKKPVKVKSEEASSEEIRREKYFFENGFDDYDEQMRRIVEENVRSERDFVEFMNELNLNLEKEFHLKNQRAKTKEQSSNTKHEEKEWEEIGLSGWTGTMVKTKEDLSKKSRQPKKVNTNIAIYQQLDLNKYSSTIKPPINSQEADLQLEDYSDKLSSIVMKEEQIMLNKTGHVVSLQPRWPITSFRGEHLDNDVYLARANNPFGHSTKWKYRNSSASDSEHHREGRSKRGVVNLYSMIKCATGCDPLIYKGYGCYCGFLGNGRALDGIDRCCKAHDYCYSSANCYFSTEYFVPYLWKCYRGKPLCAIDNGEWGGPNSCATRLCKCDLALAKCLRHHYCPRKRPVCSASPLRLLQNLVMVF